MQATYVLPVVHSSTHSAIHGTELHQWFLFSTNLTLLCVHVNTDYCCTWLENDWRRKLDVTSDLTAHYKYTRSCISVGIVCTRIHDLSRCVKVNETQTDWYMNAEIDRSVSKQLAAMPYKRRSWADIHTPTHRHEYWDLGYIEREAERERETDRGEITRFDESMSLDTPLLDLSTVHKVTVLWISSFSWRWAPW